MWVSDIARTDGIGATSLLPPTHVILTKEVLESCFGAVSINGLPKMTRVKHARLLMHGNGGRCRRRCVAKEAVRLFVTLVDKIMKRRIVLEVGGARGLKSCGEVEVSRAIEVGEP